MIDLKTSAYGRRVLEQSPLFAQMDDSSRRDLIGQAVSALREDPNGAAAAGAAVGAVATSAAHASASTNYYPPPYYRPYAY